MINPKSNGELKSMIKNGVIDCKGEDLVCDFNIDVEASIVNARDIDAWGITAWDIIAGDITVTAGGITVTAGNISAGDVIAGDVIAGNITAGSIIAGEIIARNINAWNINVESISYYAFCIVYKNIRCSSIKGTRENSFHKCLDGKVIIKKKKKELFD
jgi:hypothetical protein